MKITKKIIYIVSILAIAVLYAFISNKTKAMEIGENTYLQRAEEGFLSIQKWNGSQWMYVVHSITKFVDESGNTKIAYCVNPDLNGIGYIDGEFEGYDVQIKNYIEDQRLWRLYTNGYPYKSPEQLGVENEEDAYLATKQAAYCIIRGYTLEDVQNLYRAGQDYVQDEDLEEIQRRGQKIINAMCNLVSVGYNGTDTMQTNDILRIETVGELSLDSTDKNYYIQNYKVKSRVECSEYSVKSISNFPEGSFIADIKGNKKTKFAVNEMFKIMIPKDKIDGNFEGKIEIVGKCKNYPVFYAESVSGNYQNYVLCVDEYTNDVRATNKLKVDAYKSKLQILKLDADTKKSIQGVKFHLKYDDGEEIGTYTTNEKGEISVTNLRKGKIVIEELKSNNEYVYIKDPLTVDIEFNELKTITIENELKKGSIKIIKVDADNNDIRIPNVKFEIYNEKKELIDTVITNENGEVLLDNLPANNTKYIIKEIETAEEYELSDNEVTIELKENEIKNITFKNSKKVKQVLPRTGQYNISLFFIGMLVGAYISLFAYALIVYSTRNKKI